MNFQHVASLSGNVRLGNVIYVVTRDGKTDREREKEEMSFDERILFVTIISE